MNVFAISIHLETIVTTGGCVAHLVELRD